MRHLHIALALSLLFANVASAQGTTPPAQAPCEHQGSGNGAHAREDGVTPNAPHSPLCDQSKAYPKPSIAMPVLPGWRIVDRMNVGGFLFLNYERESPAGWDKITTIVRKAQTGEESIDEPELVKMWLDELQDEHTSVVGKPTKKDDVLTVRTKSKDGSRGTAALRVVAGPRGALFLVIVIGEWPARRQSAFSKDVDTLIRGVRIE